MFKWMYEGLNGKVSDWSLNQYRIKNCMKLESEPELEVPVIHEGPAHGELYLLCELVKVVEPSEQGMDFLALILTPFTRLLL